MTENETREKRQRLFVILGLFYIFCTFNTLPPLKLNDKKSHASRHYNRNFHKITRTQLLNGRKSVDFPLVFFFFFHSCQKSKHCFDVLKNTKKVMMLVLFGVYWALSARDDDRLACVVFGALVSKCGRSLFLWSFAIF